jgi:hypothetical protein
MAKTMIRAFLALGFATWVGLTSAWAQEPVWVASSWQAEAAASLDMAASGLNLAVVWPVGDADGGQGVLPTRSLEPRARMVSCYEAAQGWVSDDSLGGTFAGIESAKTLGSMLDHLYAQNRRWAQFSACTQASR